MTSPDALPTAPPRIVIFGNSGAGKSTLARQLATEHGLRHLDLDPLAWQDTHPPTRVPIERASKAIQAFTESAGGWVVEGCYADLLELLVLQATEMIFLDLPVATCQRNARSRPWEPHKYSSQQAQDANLPMLLDFIADYPQRDGVLGRAAHEALYRSFSGNKRRITRASRGATTTG